MDTWQPNAVVTNGVISGNSSFLIRMVDETKQANEAILNILNFVSDLDCYLLSDNRLIDTNESQLYQRDSRRLSQLKRIKRSFLTHMVKASLAGEKSSD